MGKDVEAAHSGQMRLFMPFKECRVCPSCKGNVYSERNGHDLMRTGMRTPSIKSVGWITSLANDQSVIFSDSNNWSNSFSL